MTLDDIRQILDLVKTHELTEFELERDGLKIRIRKANDHVVLAPPAAPLRAAPAASARTAPEVEPMPVAPHDASGVELAVITSPIVGTFYRSSEPGSRAFVEVGDRVKKGQVLCIIEAMKLMNEIESETDGEISAIYVENGKPVQFGDRLFAVKVDV
jgi:acetyl-CoA carboxylase biotin carboxyl carrier protein